MAKEIATRQCPSCIGPLHYSETTGRLECDYCGKSFTVAEIDARYAAQEAAAAAEAADKKAKAEKKAAKNAQPEQAPEQAQPQTPWDFTKSGSKWEEDAGGVCVYSRCSEAEA